jgi:predicted enzyme related to lactoylglutathione lyase
MPQHAISWFEIPVKDIDRAATFYETILDVTLERMDLGGPTAVFPADEDGVGGALILDGNEPSLGGATVYLDVDGRLQEVVDRIAGAGGEVLLERTAAGEYGFYALFKDSEGNKVGLFENV